MSLKNYFGTWAPKNFKTFYHNIFFKFIFILIFLLSFYQNANAQSSRDGSVLDMLVVTASRAEETLRSLSVPATIVSAEEIKNKGVDSLTQLLRSYGIETTEGAGTGSGKVIIRGFQTSVNPNESGTVLILLDGRRIGNSNAGFIPLQNIERVEIIRSSASVQYGSEATGGVVNMISRKGREIPTLFLEQDISSFDRFETKVGAAGLLFNDKLDLSFGYSHMRSGDVNVGGGLGRWPNTTIRARDNFGINLGYNFNEDHRLGLVVNGSFGHYASPGSYIGSSRATNPYGRTNRSNFSADLSYSGSLPNSFLSWQGRYFQGRTITLITSNWHTKAGYYKYTGNFKGGSASASWDNGVVSLTGGIDVYRMNYLKTTTAPPSAHIYDTALFLLGKISFFDDRLYLNGGFRFDKYEIAAEGVDLTDVTEQKKDRVTPSFGVSFLPTEWLKLRASVSSSFKMPEPISQMSYRVTSSGVYLANPDLRPESSVGWELGSDIYWNELTFGFTYFNVDYKDKIESQVVSTGPTVRQYQNLPGRTEYRGLELNASWDIGTEFDWGFQLSPYVNLTRMFRYFNTQYQKKTGYVQDLTVSYGLNFNKPSIGLSAGFDVAYLGFQLPHYTSTSQIEFGGETVMNFHIAKELIKFADKGSLIAKVDVTNLTDNFYETQDSFPEPGRAFTFGLRYEY
jgi:vitamin B12 transporter